MHLYEAHLPVADTSAAKRFYVEIVGLQFAHHDLTRDIVFLWAGADGKSMLALWGSSGEVVAAGPAHWVRFFSPLRQRTLQLLRFAADTAASTVLVL